MEEKKYIYTIDTRVHKTPTQWVEYFEAMRGVSYKGDKNAVFVKWLERGLPQKFGGGEFELFCEIDSHIRLYKLKQGN